MTLTAIITGSGRGIGRATAILYAKKGLNVVICSRTESEIQDTVKTIRSIHSRVIGLKCDVSNLLQVKSLVEETASRFGGVDILVNNAGVVFVKPLVDTTEHQWDETIDTNLKGVFLCSKAVLPYMIEKNSGSIINVSSGAGKVGFENLAAYCSSKFGVIGLTESLAAEVAHRKIRVMAICPGEVATRMQDSDPEYHQKNKGRMLRSEQVASLIVEMSSDHRRYVNGQSVDI